jgi:stage III sporulation protein SpoIIIAA
MTIDTSQTHEDLHALLTLLPVDIQKRIAADSRQNDLLEVILDLGRRPSARYTDGEHILRDEEVTREEIEFVIAGVAVFDADNRAGIARTLHRISAMKNRRGEIVGLTCRVGRAVHGTSDIIRDIIEEGHSILLLGRPGVGKTTMLREVARILGEKKRVVIVDTSNEIGGDGDIPHKAVGRARRMQVPNPAHQHETMIEAVENHNPEVIVIDEIGREAEASAARTINERGVQLVGTAHGNTLDNLLLNPTLSDLVGGIESVTLSDDEARRRGTQKTVLERRSPPTFDVVVEIQDRDRVAVHRDVTKAVDGMLYGRPEPVQLRYRDEHDQLRVEEVAVTELPAALSGRRGVGGPPPPQGREGRGRLVPRQGRGGGEERETADPRDRDGADEPALAGARPSRRPLNIVGGAAGTNGQPAKPLHILSYGVARNRLYQAARHLGADVIVVDEVKDADVLVTLKSYYRRRRKLISDAEQKRVPVYILRANTVNQMENFIAEALGLEVPAYDPFDAPLAEAKEAIAQVYSGADSVPLRPANSYVRRQQHELAKGADLYSQSHGQEPGRYVRIYRG